MLSRSLKILSKFLVVIFSLLIAYVVVVVVINLGDKPPSATAMEFEQAWNKRAAVANENNGYLFLLGFDVAETEDPKAIGLERVEWSKKVIASPTEDHLDFPQPSYNVHEHLPAGLAELVNLCNEVTQDCINAITINKTLIEEWRNNQTWVNDRYRQLIAHSDWLELSALDIRLPLPKYAEVMKAQRLVFISAFAAHSANGKPDLGELLDSDLRFWRIVLKNTDTLIGKMIAAAAIKNNFLWTNYFLLRDGAIPPSASVYQPLTEEELSMYRCLIGEWKFGASAYKVQFIKSQQEFTEKISFMLLHKQQDTINQMAENMQSLLINLDVPLTEFEAAFLRQIQQSQPQSAPSGIVHYLLHPYNPIGQILTGIATPSYITYAARSKNLEAFRRGLLHTLAVDQNEPMAAYSSPYQTQPFVVNRENRSVTVIGLGNNAHAQQMYFY